MKSLKQLREGKYVVKIRHNHPSGPQVHSYEVDAKHTNEADKKAITQHLQKHPGTVGQFHMWDNTRVEHVTNEETVTEATSVEKLHAAAIDASEKAKASPSALNHRAASDAHEKAIGAHEKAINSLMKKDGSAEEVKQHETHIKMHKNEAQKHRFAAHRLNAKNESTEVTEESIDESLKRKQDLMRVTHGAMSQADFNAKWKKPKEKNKIAGPGGIYKNVTKTEEVQKEGLEDACWKGYEAIGKKMKDGRKVPNCVPKEDADKEQNEAMTKVSVTRPIGHRIADIGPGGKEHNVQTKDWPVDHKSDQSGEKKSNKNLAKTHEDTTTIEKPVAEDSEEKNLKITKHEKAAVEAGKRGDERARQFHLDIVKKMQNESVVVEAAKKDNTKAQKHLVTVTVSDPHHDDGSKKKAKIMKRVKVSAADPKEAVKKAESHYKKHGFKVHDSLHHSVVSESLDTDEFIDSYDPEHDEEEAEETRMAKTLLRETADMAQDLVDSMEENDELEAWMQYKISSANKDIGDVYSAIAYGKDEDEDKNNDSETDSNTQNEATEEPNGGENSTALSPEEADQIGKIKTLIRLGLLDNSEMQITLRAIKKLDMDQPVTSSSERQAINVLVQKLIGVVTGDDSVFRKVRLNVQK